MNRKEGKTISISAMRKWTNENTTQEVFMWCFVFLKITFWNKFLYWLMIWQGWLWRLQYLSKRNNYIWRQVATSRKTYLANKHISSLNALAQEGEEARLQVMG